MTTFRFTRQSEKKLDRLGTVVAERIQRKLRALKRHPDIDSLLVTLEPPYDAGSFRLRIGDYRLILERKDAHTLLVLDVGHRSTIYRG